MESFLSKIDKPQPFGTSGANNGGKGSEAPSNGVVKQNNVKPKRNELNHCSYTIPRITRWRSLNLK